MALPKEAFARLNAGEGDAIYLTNTTDGGFRITTTNLEFACKMKVAERLNRSRLTEHVRIPMSDALFTAF